jgi:hypothetical protein
MVMRTLPDIPFDARGLMMLGFSKAAAENMLLMPVFQTYLRRRKHSDTLERRQELAFKHKVETGRAYETARAAYERIWQEWGNATDATMSAAREWSKELERQLGIRGRSAPALGRRKRMK